MCNANGRPVLPFNSYRAFLIRNGQGRVDSFVLDVRLLCVMTCDARKVRIIGPSRVQTPLPAFRVNRGEDVNDRVRGVYIALRSNRGDNFGRDDVRVVPFLTLSITNVFTNGSFQPLAIMVVVAHPLDRGPTFKPVGVFICRVNFRALRFEP